MGKRPKQTRIPGTESKKRNADLEAKAAAYVEARNERMELTERESETQAALVLSMEKAGVTMYRCEDSEMVVELSELKRAKVRKVKDPNAEPDE